MTTHWYLSAFSFPNVKFNLFQPQWQINQSRIMTLRIFGFWNWSTFVWPWKWIIVMLLVRVGIRNLSNICWIHEVSPWELPHLVCPAPTDWLETRSKQLIWSWSLGFLAGPTSWMTKIIIWAKGDSTPREPPGLWERHSQAEWIWRRVGTCNLAAGRILCLMSRIF